MNKRLFGKGVFVLALFSCVTTLAHAASPVGASPAISVSPSSPVANADSVKLFLRLGSASNSCEAPTFTGISFVIQESALTIYPPVFNVALSYTLGPKLPIVCPDIYDPVDYGPVFQLGKLAMGTYNVTDQNTKSQVGSFSVVSALQALTDTVYVTPQKPTVKDSLHFDLFNSSFNCCTQYFNKSVSVSDTVIMLSFEYLDSNKCACLVAGSHTAFACGPQKAGTYAIYKEQSVYCPPGQICPLGVIRSMRVGEVVVTATTGTAALTGAAMGEMFSLRELSDGVRCDYGMRRPGRVTAAVFDVRGARVEQVYDGFLGEGRHGFSWSAKAPGTYFLSIEINGEKIARRIVIAR